MGFCRNCNNGFSGRGYRGTGLCSEICHQEHHRATEVLIPTPQDRILERGQFDNPAIGQNPLAPTGD